MSGRPLARAALLAGPVVAGVILLAIHPEGLSPAGGRVLALAVWMALWWMSEAVPLAVTALLPLIAFPLMGIAGPGTVAASYVHPLILLFLGGFLLASGMQKWQLHRRLALHVLAISGGAPAAVIAAIMAVSAFLSLWISNTAAAMVMLPVGQAVVLTLRTTCPGASDAELADYNAALILGIAYAATIGGMGTLIGTPPNALFAAYMLKEHGVAIGFAHWMLLGVPIVMVLLPAAWLLLTRGVFKVPPGGHGEAGSMLKAEVAALPRLSPGERRVAMVMLATAAAWMFRPLIARLLPGLPVSDTGIALTAAALLFVLRAEGRALIGWRQVVGINWSVLILFGGGLALAAAIDSSGLDGWIAHAAEGLAGLPWLALLAIVAVIIVALGELASNTAMAAVFLPVAGATAIGMGAGPLALALPVALFASVGFMLPVATPPNAIVFSSRAVTARQMLKAGACLDVIAIIVVVVMASLLGPLVFGPG